MIQNITCVVIMIYQLRPTTGNPNPPNPAPAQLTMPDFALSPGGWGVGETASNGTFYLVVLEEYVTGNVSVFQQRTHNILLTSSFNSLLSAP